MPLYAVAAQTGHATSRSNYVSRSSNIGSSQINSYQNKPGHLYRESQDYIFMEYHREQRFNPVGLRELSPLC